MTDALSGTTVVHIDILGCSSASFAAKLVLSVPKLTVGSFLTKRLDDIEVDMATMQLKKARHRAPAATPFPSLDAMKPWIAIAMLASCVRPPNPTPVTTPAAAQSESTMPDARYCDMALATAKTVVGPYRKDATTLEESCVREVAGANGVIYGEAVGFDPMPTATCRANGWILQIGETVPQAPTQGILLVGFDDEHAGTRTFSARVEKADWRKHPGHFAANGCGSLEGVVRRQGTGWIAKVTPEE